MRSFTRALAAAAVAVAAVAGAAVAAPAVGDPAPDFGGTWFNHPSTTLADLRGRVVLVEFMRTW
jgi:hypothetical protein